MASRQFQQFQGTLLKGVVRLYGRVSVGAAGAVTFQTWDPTTRTYSTATSSGSGGIKSVTRTGTGLWTITLQDPYQRCLAMGLKTVNASGAATVVVMAEDSDGAITTASAPTVFVVLSSATATAADPASGDKIDFWLELQNSSSV